MNGYSMRWLEFATTLLLVVTVHAQPQLNPISDLLAGDANLIGPGVRVRVTTSGTAYVTRMVAKTLTPEIARAKMPFDPKPAVMESLPTVTLSSIELLLFQTPEISDVLPKSPDVVAVSMQNMNLSISAIGSGHIDDVPLAGFVTIQTNRFHLDVQVQVKRNTRGNPSLRVALCRAAANFPVMVTVQNSLTPESGARFADAVSRDGYKLFENLLCPRIIYLVEKRINQRFGLLSSKIALGDLSNFDMVKSLLAAQEEFRRTIRRNKAIARDVPFPRRRFFTQPLRRVQRQSRLQTFIDSFNMSRADSLILDYGMMEAPLISSRGIEIATSGEISRAGSRTPFGPHPISLPAPTASAFLQVAVSDFVPNSLMYHGHRIGAFNTRVDPNTPQFGPVMRTTCDLSTGSLFCVGDLFPTLRDQNPGRGVAFMFSTLKAPAVIVRPPEHGGIRFQLTGLIEVLSIDTNGDTPVGSMEIYIDASMKMKMTSRIVRGRVSLETIKLTSRSPQVLVQEELDDAGFLSREILQRIVNDILKQGVPIPVHPLFRLQKPKLTLGDRAMLLETNFQLNQHLIQQLTGERLA